MANIIFPERENASLHPPLLKMRQRLQSAPENMLKTPTAKKFHTPLQSSRKALGTVNKIMSTPTVKGQEKKLYKTLETPMRRVAQLKEEYPEIEKIIPYDPLEFEKYSIPEDLVSFNVPLHGLMGLPQTLCPAVNDIALIEPLSSEYSDCHSAELESFLQTIDELTVDLPQEFY